MNKLKDKIAELEEGEKRQEGNLSAVEDEARELLALIEQAEINISKK